MEDLFVSEHLLASKLGSAYRRTNAYKKQLETQGKDVTSLMPKVYRLNSKD
jgi:biotin operon repressor